MMMAIHFNLGMVEMIVRMTMMMQKMTALARGVLDDVDEARLVVNFRALRTLQVLVAALLDVDMVQTHQ
jgi:hypothetical protein